MNKLSKGENAHAGLKEHGVYKKAPYKDKNAATCNTCGSQFFQQIKVGRFAAESTILLGLEVPLAKQRIAFSLLKCIRCGELSEPLVTYHTGDGQADDWNHLLDTVEGKYDKRQQTKPTTGGAEEV